MRIKTHNCINIAWPQFDSWVGKILWRRERLHTPVFWPREFHGVYSPRDCQELDTTEQLSLSTVEETRISEDSSSTHNLLVWLLSIRIKHYFSPHLVKHIHKRCSLFIKYFSFFQWQLFSPGQEWAFQHVKLAAIFQHNRCSLVRSVFFSMDN